MSFVTEICQTVLRYFLLLRNEKVNPSYGFKKCGFLQYSRLKKLIYTVFTLFTFSLNIKTKTNLLFNSYQYVF